MVKDLNEIRIFIVEDSFYWSFLLEKVLSDYGNFQLQQFKDGESCIDYMGNHPDLIILDHGLEGSMDGLETFKEIREINAKVPVIVVSGQDKPQVAIDYVKLGAFTYIQKDSNASIKKLLDEVSRALHLEKLFADK